jgi:effector-binding domain-containing protein
MAEIKVKNVFPILVAFIEGKGKISDFNRDLDRLYRYIYENNYQGKIAGPTIGLFYTKFGGKYIAAVPIKEKFPVKEDIKIKRIPKIYCVSIIHKGSWKNIDDSFNKLFNYIKNHKLVWRFPVREIYLQCDGEENDYLTEIQIPLNHFR